MVILASVPVSVPSRITPVRYFSRIGCRPRWA